MSKGCRWKSCPTGPGYFRLEYRFFGKEERLALGVYPETGLKDARERRDEARKQLAAGIDPAESRKAQRAASADRAAISFEVMAREWCAKMAPRPPQCSPVTACPRTTGRRLARCSMTFGTTGIRLCGFFVASFRLTVNEDTFSQ